MSGGNSCTRFGLALAGPIFLWPTVALAHPFGEPVKLPMPYGLYILGSALALVLSFVLLALLGRSARKTGLSVVLPRPAWPVAWLQSIRLTASALLLAALVFCAVAGFIGSNDSLRNINMTFFWIIFVLGGAYTSMLFGHWYWHINPWRVLAPPRWRGVLAYPAYLGCWPAVAQLAAMVSLELFFFSTPHKLAELLVVYGVINGLGIVLFGTRKWLQRGELFCVLFNLFAACSPLYRVHCSDERARWKLTLPFARLRRLRLWHPSQCFLVLFLLSSTAYDGLRETALYFNVFWMDPLGLITFAFGEHPLKIYPQIRPWFLAWEMTLLLLSPLLYLALFAGFLWVGRALTGGDQTLALLMRRHLPSLVPIAIVYHLTHYYTLLLSQGLKIRGLVSDPFGWGWNLFGTAITGRLPWLPDMALVWTSQVLLILLGHVAAVWLAHNESLQGGSSRGNAVVNQIPMLVLMVLLTAIGLWVLAQPLQG